jgi:hypothetical protein
MYTLKEIQKLVEDSKDFTPDEQTSVALSLPTIVGSLYCLKMEQLYGKKVYV